MACAASKWQNVVGNSNLLNSFRFLIVNASMVKLAMQQIEFNVTYTQQKRGIIVLQTDGIFIVVNECCAYIFLINYLDSKERIT